MLAAVTGPPVTAVAPLQVFTHAWGNGFAGFSAWQQSNLKLRIALSGADYVRQLGSRLLPGKGD